MARLLLLGAGAALMYFLDPQAGRKRRNDFQNRMDSAKRRLAQAGDVVARDAANRTHGMLVETRQMIEARRSGDGASTQGFAGWARGVVAPWRQRRWSPSQRALAGALGAGCAAYGFLRGGVRGIVWCALGGGLLARATTNESPGSGGIFVEKTIPVAAPVAEVFAYWRHLENLPQWMSHVREVRYLGGDRYHWVVDGPAGFPVEWDAELLNVAENREMTWRSCEGSTVQHTGRVRFEADGAGTRVHVQMRYQPPGGVIGHVVAKAFGVDPKSEMSDDLARMKNTVERGLSATATGSLAR